MRHERVKTRVKYFIFTIHNTKFKSHFQRIIYKKVQNQHDIIIVCTRTCQQVYMVSINKSLFFFVNMDRNFDAQISTELKISDIQFEKTHSNFTLVNKRSPWTLLLTEKHFDPLYWYFSLFVHLGTLSFIKILQNALENSQTLVNSK